MRRLCLPASAVSKIGRKAIRLIHSSGWVAAEIRIRESTTSRTASVCGTMMTLGLALVWMNSPKCLGIVV